MGTFAVRKRARDAEEYPQFEDDWLFDNNYEKLLRSLQLSDENLDNISMDQAGSLLYVDPRGKIHENVRHHKEDELRETSRKSRATGRTNLRRGMIGEQMNGHKDSAVHSSTKDTEGPKDVKHALKKKGATMEEEDRREKKSFAVMKNVKSEPVDFDTCGMNECSNKRTRLEASNTPIPLKSAVAMENVKVEAPDSDCGGNRRKRCRKRPGLEVSNTPKKLKSSRVKKKKEIKRTSRRSLKKQRMKMTRRNQTARLLPKKKSGTKKEVNIKACRLNSKQKGSQVLHSAQSTRSRTADVVMDESYAAFLNVALMSGDHMIYTLRNGTSNIYEEDMQSAYGQTVVDNNRLDVDRPSNVKNKAATNETLGNGGIKKRMSCPNCQDTSVGSDINELDSHQRDDYHASHVSEYELFISFVEVDGKNLIYAQRHGGRKIYEEVETTSDAEINAETNATHRDPLDSLCKMDRDSGHGIESQNQFMEELMKDLGRPYNEEEYLELLEKASYQGPSDHETDLSNGMESCQTPREYGLSYLEVYRDLNAKINAANRDRSRILNLLRGLFYWLKNMSKEGSFIPWKNKRCLNFKGIAAT